MKSILLSFGFLFGTICVFAGWYKCSTYQGQIAGARVHVYLQFRDINATSNDTIPVSGVYRYDNYNDPIELRGILLKNKSLQLTEFHGNTRFAELNFQWQDKSLHGLWQSDRKSYKVSLTRIGSLSDIENQGTNEPTEILIGSSFKDEYLIGVYYKDLHDSRARLLELRIFDKKTNELRQVITFDKKDMPAGNVSTIIFSAVLARENLDKRERSIEIDEDDGRMGQSLFMTYNHETNQFIED